MKYKVGDKVKIKKPSRKCGCRAGWEEEMDCLQGKEAIIESSDTGWVNSKAVMYGLKGINWSFCEHMLRRRK